MWGRVAPLVPRERLPYAPLRPPTSIMPHSSLQHFINSLPSYHYLSCSDFYPSRLVTATSTSRRASSGSSPPLPSGISRWATRADVVTQFVRASGPGGQNVNKLSTKADVRLPLVSASPWISDPVLVALRARERNRINQKDELVVQCDEHRTQHQNLDGALSKLNFMLCMAAESLIVTEPSAETVRRVKSLQRKAQRQRKEEKIKMSAKKAQRRERIDY